MNILSITLALVLAVPLLAQSGDNPGEVQVAPTHFKVPPAPVLSPDDALKSFKIAEGFQIELVASEPLVEAPVAMVFGPDGRLWVAEMRGYMPNVDGKGEEEPIGRISVLSDENGDGKMDRNTIFADKLRLPRALALFRDGLLVAEPPHVWFFRDTNRDGKADQKTEAFADYGSQLNPEHTANGLIWAMDNWLYSANHTTRYRFLRGAWTNEPTTFRGQWGISQDDFGRLFFNSNSEALRGDFVPSRYFARNPNLRNPRGINELIVADKSVWPIRVNPGVNRGYQKDQLREDGTLATFTAGCAPCIYRGDNFPAQFQGCAFSCEPAANIVRCNQLVEQGTLISGTNAYSHAEFLASTDERFRPVALTTGPDGALYVADMYRGVIEHRIYLTTYLRQQIQSRQLETPLNLGRIYRVVSTALKNPKPEDLSKLSATELVAKLMHANGWVRDTAQRLLVERADPSSVVPLKELVLAGEHPLGQLHGLWILDALDQLDKPTLSKALRASHSKVVVAGLQLSERYISDEGILQQALALASNSSLDVLCQLLLTLGQVVPPKAEPAIIQVLQRYPNDPYLRDAAVSGLRGREMKFLEAAQTVLGENGQPLIQRLASCVARDGNLEQLDALLSWCATHLDNARTAFDGIISTFPAKNQTNTSAAKLIQLSKAPAALEILNKITNTETKSRWETLTAHLNWPGKTGAPAAAAAEVKPLTPAEQKLFEDGKALYIATCGACHQPHGMGQEGLAPPLLGTTWTTGSPERIARIVLQGVRGPINVNGKVYALDMPPLGVLEDEQLASLITYVRREWGHTASPVTPAFIAKVRQETNNREEAWTEAELLKIP